MPDEGGGYGREQIGERRSARSQSIHTQHPLSSGYDSG